MSEVIFFVADRNYFVMVLYVTKGEGVVTCSNTHYNIICINKVNFVVCCSVST